jgi:hypothetical protein
MTEKLTQPTTSNEGSQREDRTSQYQQPIVTLNNTAGVLFISILAFSLLVALLRQQAHYHELAMQLAKQQ